MLPIAFSNNTYLMFAVLGFGVVALLVIGYAQVQIQGKKSFSANFVKLFGLIFIATLAAAVVFPEIDDNIRTGVYTILGTIAGYLAGSRPTTTGAVSGAVGTPPSGGAEAETAL